MSLLLGVLLTLPVAHAFADLFRWVDEQGVVNYSNVPPAKVKATRIADSAPTVSVIPPPARAPQAQGEEREAALVRRIEQLEDAIAALRRAAVAPPADAAFPAAPAYAYVDQRAPIVYPVPVYPRQFHARGWKHTVRPLRQGWGHPRHPASPISAPHGTRAGLIVRIGR